MVSKIHKGRCSMPHQQDVAGISEITILPDGRIYVLGLSRPVLEAMRQLGMAGDLPTPLEACDDAARANSQQGEPA